MSVRRAAKAPESRRRRRPGRAQSRRAAPRNYGRWRAGTLLLVYVLMAAHVLHWRVSGRTLAPLELNEVVYTIELGIVTAGFIFMAIAVAATAVFGRFFCSWGCHILALQDLSSWLLAKLRIKPKAVRSRLLLWVPVGAALYMFLWPVAVRMWRGEPMPRLHLADDAAGWASFVTTDYWRNLPGAGVAICTFIFVGFVMVYILGSRSFCQYGCPYGAVFAMADRLAPGRIRVNGDCAQCGACTAVCSSHVRVHEEVHRYGTIVDPACMKDMDCVAVCPNQALFYGFGKPSLLTLTLNETAVRKRFDFGVWEDALMGVVFLAVLLALRGLYGVMPFFLSMAIGAVVAYAVIVMFRLVVRDAVKFNRWQLKANRRLRPVGWGFLGVATVALGLVAHGGLIHFHEWSGRRLHQQHQTARIAQGVPARDALAAKAVERLEFADRYGLVHTVVTRSNLAELYASVQRWADSACAGAWLVGERPGELRFRMLHARALGQLGRLPEAEREYRMALALSPGSADARYGLAGVKFKLGQGAEAEALLREALAGRTDFVEAHYDLGALLVARGDVAGGIGHLEAAVRINPEFGDGHYNLAVACMMAGDQAGARRAMARAYELQPGDERTAALREHLQQTFGVGP